MKKFLVFLCLLIFASNVYALDLSSKNAIMYNLNDDKIIYEENAYDRVKIASLTKIMTVYVAINHIDDMEKSITITNDMLKDLIKLDAYVIGLKKGDKLNYKDLLSATYISSGADAARALSISIAGSEENFVKWMNDEASDLNLSNTHFKNVIGLDDNDAYSTVYEVSILLKKALENDTFKTIFETDEYTLSNGIEVKSSMRDAAKTYKIDIPYIKGGKTGYTILAGKCLASVAYDAKNDIYYMLVTTGASTSKQNAYHVLDAANMYKYYFENYKYYTVINKDEAIINIDAPYSKTEASIKVTEDIKYYTNQYNEELVKIEYDGLKKIKKSLKKDNFLGKIKVYYDNELLGEYNAYLKDDVKFSLLKFTKVHFKIILGTIILLLLIIKFKHRRA